MNTQSGTRDRATGKAGAKQTARKEVVKEAVRLVLDSCEEEEHRWIEIGSEAEQALKEGQERKSLSDKECEVLLGLTAERDVRLRHIAEQRRELRGR